MEKLSHTAGWHAGHGKTMSLSLVSVALMSGSDLWTGGFESMSLAAVPKKCWWGGVGKGVVRICSGQPCIVPNATTHVIV